MKEVLLLLLFIATVKSSSEDEKKTASLARYYLGIVHMHREWAVGIALTTDRIYQKGDGLTPGKQKELRDAREETLEALSTSLTKPFVCLRSVDHSCEQKHPSSSQKYRQCLKESLYPCVQKETASFIKAYAQFSTKSTSVEDKKL